METKQGIKKVFDQILEWKKLPSYQAERRMDIFFGIYLEKILKAKGFFDKGEQLVIIPEFPQKAWNKETGKETDDNRSVKIDYLVASNEKMYAVELKTDTKSVNVDQINYYERFLNKVWPEHKELVKTLFEASNEKDKYSKLQSLINPIQYGDEKQPTGVIYIGPNGIGEKLTERLNKLKESNSITDSVKSKFKVIEFKDICTMNVGDDELFNLFVETLGKWNEPCK